MDRRVRKTREALYASLVSLIVTKGYDATTVQDVIAEADVGRSTFYEHFSSKEDLLRYGFGRLREQIESVRATVGVQPFAFVAPLFEHARNHAGLYAALLGGRGGVIAQRHFREVLSELVAEEVRHAGDPAAAFAVGSIVGVLEAWLEKPRRGNQDALVVWLIDALQRSLKAKR